MGNFQFCFLQGSYSTGKTGRFNLFRVSLGGLISIAPTHKCYVPRESLINEYRFESIFDPTKFSW